MTARAILFDFGGTLDSDGVPWPQRFFPIYRELGVDPGWDAFLKAFYASDDTLASRHALRGLDIQDTVRLQAQGVLEILGESGELAGSVAARFAAESRRQFSRNRGLLTTLRERRRLGIVSNFYGNLEGILAAEGLRELFDVVVDSGAAGVAKPDAAIFRLALTALGVRPEEALMVGDSLGRDIRGAEALGMPHAWLDLSAQPPCCSKGLRLRALTELASGEPQPAGREAMASRRASKEGPLAGRGRG